MVTKRQNEPESMFHQPPDADDLGELRELNRLFLIYLQTAARRGGDCMGLDRAVMRGLRRAQPPVIEAMSAFPRAFFALDVGEEPLTASTVTVLPTTQLEQMREAFALTALLSVWHMSRRRGYQARMFLGLSAASMGRLRAVPLGRLHLLTQRTGVLRCAFPDALRLWEVLLEQSGLRLPRALTLVGLQPDLGPERMGHTAALGPLGRVTG